jgi:hypothetical protein
VDGTGSGSCPMAGFGISGVEPSGSATSQSVSYCSTCSHYEFNLNPFADRTAD